MARYEVQGLNSIFTSKKEAFRQTRALASAVYEAKCALGKSHKQAKEEAKIAVIELAE